MIYNDTNLNYESPEENVYNLESIFEIGKDESTKDFRKIVSKMQCLDINNALTISKKIMNGKRKLLTNE